MGLIGLEARRRIGGAVPLWRGVGLSVAVMLAFALAGCENFRQTSAEDESAMPQRSADESAAVEITVEDEADEVADASEAVKPDERVREVQIYLAKLGYEPGPADGVLGNRTVDAIRDYQEVAGLPADGEVGAVLLESLKSGEYRKPASATSQMIVTGSSATAALASAPRLPANGVFGADLGDIQPIFTVGDAFVWSSGRVDRVVRVGADNVVWRASDGSSRTAFRYIATPYIEWRNEAREVLSAIAINPQEIWPLSIGAGIEFTVTNTIRGMRGEEAVGESMEEWRCSRGADTVVEVPAGRFEAIVVTCVREPVPDRGWHKRVWYYAPAVRHIVRLDSFDFANQRSSNRLISLRPAWKDWPPAARAGLDWAVQDTLSNGTEGVGVEWRSSGVGTKLIILPGREFSARAGERCRKYALIQVPPMTARVYPAIACWDGTREKWLVPGLDDASAPIAAVG